MNRFVKFTPLVIALLFSVCLENSFDVSASVPGQVVASGQATGSAINLPVDTVIVAKFVAELDSGVCKPRDLLETEIVHDVKGGKDTVLKSGWHVTGQIAKVAGPDPQGMYGVWIVFGNVIPKDGSPTTIHMDIQAIAPPETPENYSPDPAPPFVSIHPAGVGRHGELTKMSKGVIDLADVVLASGNAEGTHVTVLVSKKGNLHLVKGTQVAFRLVKP